MQKIFFLDIDDCLIHTTQLTLDHLEVIRKSLDDFGVSVSQEITHTFAVHAQLQYDQHQGKSISSNDEKIFQTFMDRLAELEKPIIEKWGEMKRWSREVNLYIAAEKHGVFLTQTVIQKTVERLWTIITQKAGFYEDSLPFLKKLFSQKIPVFLITSSDSRLTFDDAKKLFFYDPDYSRHLKMQRLTKFLDLGIPNSHIFIGDPYDKPNPWVFESALSEAKKEFGDQCKAIMVGDSINNDLLPAQFAGYTKLYWINRQNDASKGNILDGIIEIHSLQNISV